MTREENNRELASVPLTASRDGLTLEATIPRSAVPSARRAPLRVAAKLVFKKGEPEQRFDFTFPELSVAPPASPASTTTGAKPARRRRTAAAPPAPAPAAVDAGASSDGIGSTSSRGTDHIAGAWLTSADVGRDDVHADGHDVRRCIERSRRR